MRDLTFQLARDCCYLKEIIKRIVARVRLPALRPVVTLLCGLLGRLLIVRLLWLLCTAKEILLLKRR